ncbi:MAG: 5-formyltetrahydrofolate cyclo-ligase [Bariatricus sp.]|nr:5-formyltetrahydrofolate cyclo-ligase [Bariatricus sp.]
MDTKKQIRARILKARDLLSRQEIEEKSEQICRKILESPEFIQADTVLLYMPIKSEVRTKKILEEAWKAAKRVGVPRVEGNQMVFARIDSLKDLIPGTWNIPEPDHYCPVITDIDSRTVVLMPGAAFDRNRNRIGYGGGYYDKYFAGCRPGFKFALAYELQMTDEIPSESYDLKPDCIVTESHIYAG